SQGFSIVKYDKAWIPAAFTHIPCKMPCFIPPIEDFYRSNSGEVMDVAMKGGSILLVMLGPAGDQEFAGRQQAVPTTEAILQIIPRRKNWLHKMGYRIPQASGIH